MRATTIIAICTFAMSMGCSDSTRPTTAADVSGTWIRQETMPGNRFDMTLLADASSLQGTGDFTFEAGLGGTSTVEGSVAGNVVSLDFTLVTDFPGNPVTSTAHFRGQLVAHELRGAMRYGTTPSSPIVFLRPGPD